jgi:curved DNA-binding protein CbpA
VTADADPYAVLGVPRGAGEAEIHAAYRAAVRRTHPDAGGSSAAFEAVQQAYEVLRQRPRRAAGDATATHRQARPGPAAPHTASMADLLAESQRLEDEARRLAGMAARQSGKDEPTESVGAVLRDAGAQLRDAADEGMRELRRLIRRRL